jgi:hypothetical protein
MVANNRPIQSAANTPIFPATIEKGNGVGSATAAKSGA